MNIFWIINFGNEGDKGFVNVRNQRGCLEKGKDKLRNVLFCMMSEFFEKQGV